MTIEDHFDKYCPLIGRTPELKNKFKKLKQYLLSNYEKYLKQLKKDKNNIEDKNNIYDEVVYSIESLICYLNRIGGCNDKPIDILTGKNVKYTEFEIYEKFNEKKLTEEEKIELNASKEKERKKEEDLLARNIKFSDGIPVYLKVNRKKEKELNEKVKYGEKIFKNQVLSLYFYEITDYNESENFVCIYDKIEKGA